MSVLSQISWVYTHDLSNCVAFYRDSLGLAVVRDAGAAMIFETAPGARLGVCEAFAGRVVQPEGGMITLVVADAAEVDAFYRRIEARDIPTRGSPETLERFGIYSFFCEDPNGYVIEIQCFLDGVA